MTDDRIVRMLRVSGSDPVQQEAADEIERLRAELAAEREKTADYGKQIDRLADEIDWGEDEVVAQEKALEEVEAERDALRAELASEREAHEILLTERNMRHFQMTQSIRAERDTLRALLEDAREAIISDVPIWPVIARIDALLNKGGGIA